MLLKLGFSLWPAIRKENGKMEEKGAKVGVGSKNKHKGGDRGKLQRGKIQGGGTGKRERMRQQQRDRLWRETEPRI